VVKLFKGPLGEGVPALVGSGKKPKKALAVGLIWLGAITFAAPLPPGPRPIWVRQVPPEEVQLTLVVGS
jgi:hypothetical protein